MSMMRHGHALGVKEQLLAGQSITKLEALAVFGVSNLTSVISDMRKNGHMVQSRTITMAEAIRNLNKVAHFSPPETLPVTEIKMTQYWIER